MPYKEAPEPVPIADMLETRHRLDCTVCQKLREIYKSTNDEKIKLDCRVAMAMAKKMSDKLKEYKEKYGAEGIITWA
jgi:hypothetical protein